MPRLIRKSLMRTHGMLLLALGGYWHGAWSLAAGVEEAEVMSTSIWCRTGERTGGAIR
jgi:hypothetical protein